MISKQRHHHRTPTSLVDVYHQYENYSPAADISRAPSTVLSSSGISSSMQPSQGHTSGLRNYRELENDRTFSGLKTPLHRNNSPMDLSQGRIENSEGPISEYLLRSISAKKYERKCSSADNKQRSVIKLWNNCVTAVSTDQDGGPAVSGTTTGNEIIKNTNDRILVSAVVKNDPCLDINSRNIPKSNTLGNCGEEYGNYGYGQVIEDGADYLRSSYCAALSDDRSLLEKPARPKLKADAPVYMSKRLPVSRSKLNLGSHTMNLLYEPNKDVDRQSVYDDFQSDITRRRLLTSLSLLQKSPTDFVTPDQTGITQRPSSSSSTQSSSLTIYNLGVWPVSDRGVKLPAAKSTGCWVTDGDNAHWKVQLTDRELVQVIHANPGDPVFRRFGLGSHRNPYLDLPFGYNSATGFHSGTRLSSRCGQTSSRLTKQNKCSLRTGRLNKSAGTVRGSSIGGVVGQTLSTERHTAALDVCGLSKVPNVVDKDYQKPLGTSQLTLASHDNAVDDRFSDYLKGGKCRQGTFDRGESLPDDILRDRTIIITVPNNSPRLLSDDELDDVERCSTQAIYASSRRLKSDGKFSHPQPDSETRTGITTDRRYDRHHLPSEQLANEKSEALFEKNIQKIQIYIPH